MLMYAQQFVAQERSMTALTAVVETNKRVVDNEVQNIKAQSARAESGA